MNHSEQLNEIGAALAAAQAEIRAAVKASDNPAYKIGNKVSKYADLAAVWEACRGPLSKHKLSIIQTTEFDEKDVWLVTRLLHSSGQFISGRYPLRPTKHDPQGMGSAMTYARRYTVAAMVGVVADEDDDGNRASGLNGNGMANGKDADTGDLPLDEFQRNNVMDLLASTNSDIEAFCALGKVPSVAAIKQRDYQDVITLLNAKRAKQAKEKAKAPANA